MNFDLSKKFKNIVEKQKTNSAIIFPNGKKISFNDLDLKSDYLSKWMLSKKRINSRVCIYSAKNDLVFFLILACIKSGFSYTILDTEAPSARNINIIKILNPCFIFNATGTKLVLSKKFKKRIILKKNIKLIIESKKTDYSKQYLNKIKANTVIYIMFTSGSTGNPKGVSISARGVMNFIKWTKQQYNFQKDEVFSSLNGLYFDNSVFDLYASIFNGYPLVPFNKEELLDPYFFIKTMKKFRITNWFSVPSLIIYFLKFNVFKLKDFFSLKRIIFGGEAFPKKELKKIFKNVAKKIKLFNVYGPTECTCICSNYGIKASDFNKKEMSRYAPLGKKMIKKFNYKIVNNKNQLVNKGEKGELILGGENVGLGYFNNKNETKKKFFSVFSKNKKINRFYKTGDIVYKDKENNHIYFVSRSDNQIKFMGYRIELDEIEIAINKISYVKRCVVTFGKKNNSNEITAWIVPKDQNRHDYRKELSKKLPNYMIPRTYNVINKMPMNLNGKIDKLKLKKNYYE